eukprot:1975423-Prorocentrum_lima.AAC.1
MTSSLVGSEMCIRDRMHPSLWLMIKRKKPEAKITTFAGTHAWIKGPVSYTHLTLPTICSV